jgi:hypothetical protein
MRKVYRAQTKAGALVIVCEAKTCNNPSGSVKIAVSS